MHTNHSHMTTDDDNAEPSVPLAAPASPPTQPGELRLPERRSNWPTTLGVVAIVFGALGCLGAIWGVVGTLLFPAAATRMPPNQAALAQAMAEMSSTYLITSILTAPAAVILLITGIGLFKRRKWGITTGKVWAIIKMIVVVVSTYLGSVAQRAFSERMAQDPNMPQGAYSYIEISNLIWAVTGILWGCALPIFILTWFSRYKIKAEVAAWT